MILDEPTAALDAIAESDIYQKYQELARGKSSVFISHRLASTRFCDRIILLGSGLIQYHDRTVLIQKPRHHQPLQFPAGKLDRILIHFLYKRRGKDDTHQAFVRLL